MIAEECISEDAVLGGRLLLRQPLRGHRVGHDAILLAASTRARVGERAADLGAGVGAAGLALAARMPGLNVALVDNDADLCALAADNARRNGLGDRVTVACADAGDAEALGSAGLARESLDCVLMNPPFFDARRHNVSPDPRRRSAHVGSPELLGRWVGAAAWLLKPGGVLTLIWRADVLADVWLALPADIGARLVLPVLPREGAQAVRVLIRAQKGMPISQATCTPLVLHDAHGRPTAAAEAVLRRAEPLEFT